MLSEPGKKRAYDRELEADGGMGEGSTFHTAGSPSGVVRTRTRTRTKNVTLTLPSMSTASNTTSTTTLPTRRCTPPSPEYQAAARDAESDIQLLLSRRAERDARERNMPAGEVRLRLRAWKDLSARFEGDVEMGAYCEGRVRALEGREGIMRTGRTWVDRVDGR